MGRQQHRRAKEKRTGRVRSTTKQHGKQDAELLAAMERYRQLEERLGSGNTDSSQVTGISRGADLSEVWQTVVVGNDMLSHFEGEQTQLELVYPGIRRSSDFSLRLLVALAWLLAAACCWQMHQRGILGEWWARWPYVAGACIGLAWWLWLRPSLLGLVIMGLSALAAILPSWVPQRPSRGTEESMTVTAHPQAR